MFKPKYNSVFSSSGDILTKHKEKRNNIFPKKFWERICQKSEELKQFRPSLLKVWELKPPH